MMVSIFRMNSRELSQALHGFNCVQSILIGRKRKYKKIKIEKEMVESD